MTASITLNTEAIVNKNGAFVKSQFKPGKFADPTTLANGIVLFLVYPFKLSEKRTIIEPLDADIELRLYAGDDSKQLAIVEGKSFRFKLPFRIGPYLGNAGRKLYFR